MPNNIDSTNVNLNKRKEISPLKDILGRTRYQTKRLRKNTRTILEEYICHSDDGLDLVHTDRSDTCYIMPLTSSPQNSATAQGEHLGGDSVIPTSQIPTTTSGANSMIQSRLQYQFPTAPLSNVDEAVRRAVNAAETNMRMKHQEELDALRNELQAIKSSISGQNRTSNNRRQTINAHSAGAIPKHSYSQAPNNQYIYQAPNNQYNEINTGTNVSNSVQQPVFSNIPPTANIPQAPINMQTGQPPTYQQNFNVPPPPYINPNLPYLYPNQPSMNQNQRPNMMPSFNESMGSTHQKIVPIERWKIRYNGDGSVSNFLFQVNTLRRRNLYEEIDVFNNFDLMLEGRAHKFYWSFLQEYPRATYAAFVRAFSIEFGSTEKDCMIMANLAQKRQAFNESFTSFVDGMRDLLDRMEHPIPESSFISLVKSNCKPELSNLLFAVPINSKEALSRAGKDAEQQLSYQNKLFKAYPNKYEGRRNISELEIDDPLVKIEELEAQINSLKIQTQRKPYNAGGNIQRNEQGSSNNDVIIPGCFNCFDPNHYQRDCPKEVTEIYCFTCGTRGVITPKCQRCRSKNWRKDGVMTGAQRPQ